MRTSSTAPRTRSDAGLRPELAVGTIFTLGLSDALGAAAEIGFKELIQRAISELERAVEQQALYLAK